MLAPKNAPLVLRVKALAKSGKRRAARTAGYVQRCAARSMLFGLLMLLPGSEGDCSAERLIGTRPPEWQVQHWLNSAPLKLEDLRGKVVLVRWWTAPDCPYCRATAPALNEFYRENRHRGLEVVGFYHHKSDDPLRIGDVKKYVDNFGFEFPVAIDTDWRTLKQWWLDDDDHRWTSVSFLIDRRGVIRRIHPGGQYVKGDKDYAEMKAKIEELLKEK